MGTPSTKSLVLQLLSAAEGNSVNVRALIRGCAAFGVSQNSLRVTLARLKTAGLVELAGRGEYQLGPRAQPLQREVSNWRQFDARHVSWDGSWVMVSTAGLSRSDRPVNRQRATALRLLGMRELSEGLWLRPNNLSGGTVGVRSRLRGLGLAIDAPVFRADEFDPASTVQAMSLWDAETLDRRYRELTEAMNLSACQLLSRPLSQSAPEAFLLGSEVITAIVTDPSLPAPIVDATARTEMVAAMTRYDVMGRGLWRQILSPEHRAESAASQPLEARGEL